MPNDQWLSWSSNDAIIDLENLKNNHVTLRSYIFRTKNYFLIRFDILMTEGHSFRILKFLINIKCRATTGRQS